MKGDSEPREMIIGVEYDIDVLWGDGEHNNAVKSIDG